jgi:hypothetical protein
LIDEAVGNVTVASIDIASMELSRKSALAGKLVMLYSTLVDTEKASWALCRDLRLVASGKEPVTEFGKVPQGRLVVRASANALRDAVGNLVGRLKDLERLADIYRGGLHREMLGFDVYKGKYVEPTGILCMACPHLREIINLSTGYMVFPSKVPTPEATRKISETLHDAARTAVPIGHMWPDELVTIYSDTLTKMYLAEMGVTELHIHSRADMQPALVQAEQDVGKVEHARIRLAGYVRTTLPLERVIE